VTTPAQILAGLPAILEKDWGQSIESARVLSGGMNSVAVMLELPRKRVVAKWVPAQGRDDLIRGAEVARLLGEHGFRTGPPVPTSEGKLTAPFLDGELAILKEVEGGPLTSDPDDLWAWGATLARLHAVTASKGSGPFFPWLSENGTDPDREAWVRQAVEDVLRDYANLPQLTWAQLHTDPEPEAFRRDEYGDVGVIDWAGSIRGPVLYDLASAIMYAGHGSAADQLVAGYRSVGVLSEAELDGHLRLFQRFRGAVQAAYFSKRIHDSDLTGIDSDEENAKGLRDAAELIRLASD
jgi:homoserine kinase type II